MLTIGIFLTNGTEEVVEAFAASSGVKILPFTDFKAMQQAFPEFDAAILQNSSYTPEIAAAAAASPKLKWLQAAATGVDAFRKNGVPSHVLLTNAGDIWADCVAEHAMALLLGMTRALPTVARLGARHLWDRAQVTPLLRSLSGKKMLVVGFGNIGKAIARRAQVFGMEIAAVSRRAGEGGELVGRIEPTARLRDFLPDADVVAVSLPLTAETSGLFGAEEFALMKPSSLFVNVSRGEVVVQDALVAALGDGRIGGAALDVASPEPLPSDHPLWTFDNVLISPHVGGFDDGPSFVKLGKLCRDNAERLLAGQALRNLV